MVEDRNARRYLAAFGLEESAPSGSVIGWLLQCIVASGPAAGMSLDEATSAIKAATGLAFDRGELRDCVANDPSLGLSITSHNVPLLILTSAAREEAIERLERAGKNEAEVLSEWTDSIGSSIQELGLPVEVVLDDFRAFYTNVAVVHGMESVALVYGTREEANEFLANLDSEVWSTVPQRNDKYLAFCRQAFPGFFLQALGKRAVFVAKLLDCVFDLCRLNLAPATSRLLLAQLDGLTAYLDTNILFRLLGLHGPAAVLDVRRTLQLGLNAKVDFRITPRTLTEFENAAHHAVEKGGPVQALPPEAILSLDPALDDRAYFAEYYRLLKRPATKADVQASLRNLARTLERFGIRVWTEKVADIEKRDEEVMDLARDLKTYFEDIESKKPPNSQREISWEGAQHDAFHIKLIQVLRPSKARSFKDAKIWFLTMHYALARSSCRSAAKRKSLPEAILLDQFHQLLRSVLPRADRFDETFVRNLRSPWFQAHRGNYVAASSAVVARLANFSGSLPAEHFANIVADASFQSRVAGVISSHPPSQEKAVAELVDQRMAQELASERERRIKADGVAASRATKIEEEKRNRADTSEAAARELAQLATDLEVSRADLEAVKRARDDDKAAFARKISEIEARDLQRANRLCNIAGAALLAAEIPLWMWTDGWSVPGSPINSLAIGCLLFGMATWIFVRKKPWSSVVPVIVGLVLAAIAVAPWPAPSPVTPAKSSGTRPSSPAASVPASGRPATQTPLK